MIFDFGVPTCFRKYSLSLDNGLDDIVPCTDPEISVRGGGGGPENFLSHQRISQRALRTVD